MEYAFVGDVAIIKDRNGVQPHDTFSICAEGATGISVNGVPYKLVCETARIPVSALQPKNSVLFERGDKKYIGESFTYKNGHVFPVSDINLIPVVLSLNRTVDLLVKRVKEISEKLNEHDRKINISDIF